MKKFESIFIISIVIFIIFFIIDKKQPSAYERGKKICEEYYKIELKGKVIKTYIDTLNKYSFTYLIKQKNDTILRVNEVSNYIEGLKYILEVGDSIYKPKNTFKNYIFKKGLKTKIIYKQGTDCFCGDSNPPDCVEKMKYIKTTRWL